MDLRQYLDQLGRTNWQGFAKRCGTTSSYLTQLYGGHRKPSVSLAVKIERASGGSVRCETMLPDIDWQYLRDSKSAEPPKDSAA